jgi:RHS repeat-associated protein
MNHIKKTIICIVICIGISFSEAQIIYQANIHQLPTPHSGNEEYIGRDEVNLQPGFEYQATTGNSFIARIDNTIVANYDYSSNTALDGSTRVINTNFAVGTLPGSANVSATGAFTYGIPLQLPPGTAGMMPNLSLVYSSQAGNGLCGMGWNLAGLSAITRVGANIYNDGFVDGVNFDSNDKYMLDGQRLVPFAGSNIFHTEVESFSKVEKFGSWGTNNLCPSYWVVTTKGGYSMEYGATADAQLQINNWQKDVLSWQCNKVTDPNGNYYTIQYAKDEANGESYPISIEYTGNAAAGLQPYNKVAFLYSKKDNPFTGYIGGGEIGPNNFHGGCKLSQTVVLDKIITYIENCNVNTYTLTYVHDAFNTFLNQIQLCTYTGDCLNSTVFNYGAAANLVTPEQITGYHLPDICSDFDGNGKSEILCYSNSSGNIDFKKLDQTTHSFITASNNTGGKICQFLVGDFDGNGKKSVIPIFFDSTGFNNSCANKNTFTIKYIIRESGVTWFSNPNINSDCSPNNLTFYQKKFKKGSRNQGAKLQFECADFDGDGKEEIAIIEKAVTSGGGNSTGYFQFLKVNNNVLTLIPSNLNNQSHFTTNCTISDNVVLGDFNGDRKIDFLVTDNITSQIFINAEINGVWNWKSYYNYNLGYPNSYHKIFPGDFNGDGKTDLLTYNINGGWEVGINMDNFIFGIQAPSFTQLNSLGFTDPLDDNSKYYLNVLDVNGDGLADIIADLMVETFHITTAYTPSGASYPVKVTDYFNDHSKHILLATGNGFNHVIDQTDFLTHHNYFDAIKPNYGDFNGDGKIDNYVNGSINYYFKNDLSSALTKVTDGSNFITTVNYERLSENIVFNTYNSNIQYPAISIGFPLLITNKINRLLNTTDEVKETYTFNDPRLHLQGKGFLGFNYITSSILKVNGGSNYITQTMNDGVDWNYFIMKPKWTQQYIGSMLVSQTQSILHYFTLDANTHRFFPYIVSTHSINYLDNSFSTVNMQYNTDGNLVNSSSINSLNINSSTSNTYIAKGSWGIPNKLATTSSTTTKPGSTFTQAANMTYDTKGNLIGTISNPNQAGSLKTTITLDNYGFGLIAKTAVIATTGSTMPARISETEYDPKGRFSTKKKNALAQISTYGYNSKNGTVINATDINGHTIYSNYNSLGVLLNSTDALGTTYYNSGYIANYTGTAIAPADAAYYSTVQAPNTAIATSFTNALGKQRVSYGTTYNKIFKSENIYGSDGLLTSQTNTHDASSSPIITSFQYDPTYLYANNIDYNNGQAISTAYKNPSTNTETNTAPDGSTFIKEYNTIGQLLKSTDPSGQVIYRYHANGQISNIISPSGNINIVYNNLGQQISLTDPNAGTMQYTYNEYGELATQTDANAHTSTIKYDVLGRNTQTIIPEGTISTVYDTKPNGKGLPTKTTATLNNYTTAIENDYDYLSRSTQTIETVSGQNYTYKTVYDANTGNIAQTEYPSGFKLNYVYDNNGDLLAIKRADNNTYIWQVDHIDGYGRLDKYILGNNVLKITSAYNTQNQTLSQQSTQKINTGAATYLQKNQYIFDSKNGDLTMKQNLLSTPALREHYYYDAANRFIEQKQGNATSTTTSTSNISKLTVQYDNNGNIIDKSDVGKYFYLDLAHRNALNYVTHRSPTCMTPPDPADANRNPIAISNNQQDISYTSFGNPATITENGYTLSFDYGYDKQRRHTKLKDVSGNTVYERTYLTNYEIETSNGITQKIHYISSPSGLVAMYIDDGQNPQMYYILKDHLGSITALVDENGTVVQEYSYSPYGERSLTTDATGTGKFLIYRGYTNHEHLDEFALINMNARLYDPVIGRVLSPDNLIVLIDNSQNYNRYTYCFNNPLKYSDPTGNWGGWDDLAAITIGASVNVYTHWDKITQSGSIDFVALGEAAVIGGVAGEVALLTGGAAVGYLAGAGVIAGTGGIAGGAIIGVVGGATGSMVKQIGNNQVFGDPISGKEVLRDAAIGGVMGGLIGGGVALYKGQNVWWGTPKVPTTLQIKPEESVKPNPAAEANAGGKVDVEYSQKITLLKTTERGTEKLTLNIVDESQTKFNGVRVLDKTPDETWSWLTNGGSVETSTSGVSTFTTSNGVIYNYYPQSSTFNGIGPSIKVIFNGTANLTLRW